VRGLIDRFWYLVDSETIVLFQWLFYTGCFVCGFHDLRVNQAPMTLQDTMSHQSFIMWAWMNMAGPVCALLGRLIIRNSRFSYSGMWLQLGGDATVNCAMAAYTVATFHAETWSKGVYGGILGIFTYIATMVLVMRDIRRLRAVGRLL
jgi:hypothetical protein